MTRDDAFKLAYATSKLHMSIQDRIGCVTPRRVMSWRAGFGQPWQAVCDAVSSIRREKWRFADA